MYKTARKWFLSVYAGHVLDLAERKLKRLTAYADEIDKSLEAAEKWLNGLRGTLKKLKKVGQSTKIYVGMKGQGQWYGLKLIDQGEPGELEPRYVWGEGVNRIKFDKDYESLYADEAVRLTKNQVGMYIERWRREKTRALNSMERSQEERIHPGQRKKQDDELVTLNLIIRECKKYTSKAKAYKTKASSTLKVDLTGWKYLTDYHKEEQDWLKRKIEEDPDTEGKPQSLEKAMKGYMIRLMTQGWRDPPEIQVTLFFDPHQKRAGQWSIREKHLQVDVMHLAPLRSVENFRKGLEKIEGTLRHELQHVGQDALRQIKYLKEDAGLPSRKIRQKGADPSGHPLEQVDKKKIQEAKKSLTAFMVALRKLKNDGQKTKKFTFYHATGAPVKLFAKLRVRNLLRQTGEVQETYYHLYEGNGSYAGDWKDLKEVREFVNRYYVEPIAQMKKEGPRIRWDKPRIQHSLRDVEFQTDLGNAVEYFMANLTNVGKKDWREYFHAFTGSKAHEVYNPHWFFKGIKQNRKKWQVAVREFTKEVKKRGFET